MKVDLFERQKRAGVFIFIGFFAISWNYISGVELFSYPNKINFIGFSFLTSGILHLLQAKLLEAKVMQERQAYDFLITFGPFFFMMNRYLF